MSDFPGYVPDGIMLGFVTCPDGHQHDLVIHGSTMELSIVAKILCLEPDPEWIEKTKRGEGDGGPLVLKQSDGVGYATLQPVRRASDVIAQHVEATFED